MSRAARGRASLAGAARPAHRLGAALHASSRGPDASIVGRGCTIANRPRSSRSRLARRSRIAAPATPVRSVRPGARQTTTTSDVTGPSTSSAIRSTRTPRSPPRLAAAPWRTPSSSRRSWRRDPRSRTAWRGRCCSTRWSTRPPASRSLPPATGRLRDGRRRPAVPARQREDLHRSGARDGGHARVRASEGGAVIILSFSAPRVPHRDERGRWAQDHAPQPGELGGRGCGRRAGCWSRTGRSASSRAPTTRCGNRRRAAWAAPRRLKPFADAVSGPT